MNDIDLKFDEMNKKLCTAKQELGKQLKGNESAGKRARLILQQVKRDASEVRDSSLYLFNSRKQN